jgi:hypothetical protein
LLWCDWQEPEQSRSFAEDFLGNFFYCVRESVLAFVGLDHGLVVDNCLSLFGQKVKSKENEEHALGEKRHTTEPANTIRDSSILHLRDPLDRNKPGTDQSDCAC